MAEIEIAPLTDRLSDQEIADLARQMEKLGAGQLPQGDATAHGTVGDALSDDALDEIMDRLDMNDAAGEIYLPVEFEGVIEVGDLRIASLQALLDALEELKEELSLEEEEEEEEEEEDEDEDEDDRRAHEAELKSAWRTFHDGAQTALDRKMPLHVKP